MASTTPSAAETRGGERGFPLVPDAGDRDTSTLAALRARHAGTFVKLAFRGDEVRQSDVFAALLEHRVRFELVFGGIEEVQGDTFGNLTLALDGEPDDVRAAVAAVGALVPTTELTR